MALSLAETLRLAVEGPKPGLSDHAAARVRGSDLVAMAKLAAAHRVAPWLSAAIAAEPSLANLPGTEAVHRIAAFQTMHSLRLFAELTTIVTKLNSVEIPVVVLKGPVLAQRYYPEPALRPYGDLDLLIHERDLVEVSHMLIERNYREKNNEGDQGGERLHPHHGIFQRIFLNDATALIVEVHCDHLQIGLEPVGMSQIWAETSPVSFGPGVARALEDHDMFIQLCVHLQRHGYERLIWMKDIDLMVRAGTLDWAAVGERAEKQGCTAAVGYALALLPKILNTPLPEGARALSERHGALSNLLYRRTWPARRIQRLEQQRQWRFRRLVQFSPETGFFRGGLGAFLTSGRRKDKARILIAGARRRFHAKSG